MSSKAQDGRDKLAKVLDREVEIAKDDLARALEQTRQRILDAQRALQDGLGVATTVSGQGMVLGQEGSRIDEYVGLYMAAERRRVHLLDLYDEANGTRSPEAAAAEAEAFQRSLEEAATAEREFGMYSLDGQNKVAEVVDNASRAADLDSAWTLALAALESLSEMEQYAEATDTVVREAVYAALQDAFSVEA
jgi:hypothetical protein